MISIIVVAVMVILLVYLAQQIPSPLNWILYAIAAVAILLVLLRHLGIEGM